MTPHPDLYRETHFWTSLMGQLVQEHHSLQGLNQSPSRLKRYLYVRTTSRLSFLSICGVARTLCRIWLMYQKDSLTLDNNKKPSGSSNPTQRDQRPPSKAQPGSRPVNHRPTKSQEEALKAARRRQEPSSKAESSRSPNRKSRRPRRNSDSSLISFDVRPTPADKDRARRDGKDRTKSGKPSRRLDIIDQLDATSIYGTGCTYHLLAPVFAFR